MSRRPSSNRLALLDSEQRLDDLQDGVGNSDHRKYEGRSKSS